MFVGVFLSVFFICLVHLFIRYLKWRCVDNIWARSYVPFVPPLPLFGNDFFVLIGLETTQDAVVRKYNYLKDYKFGGTFSASAPTFFPKDPNLINNILVRDFNYFTDRGMHVDTKLNPLTDHLFHANGDKWRILRAKLSPVFSLAKLKTMHGQLIACAEELQNVLRKSTQKDNSHVIDCKETMAKFTTDVIGSCAYGLTMDALSDPRNKFRIMGRSIFAPTFQIKFKQFLRQVLRNVHPKLVRLVKLKLRPDTVDKFFMDLVKDTIRKREANNVKRNDFIQLLINLRKGDENNSEKMEQPQKKVLSMVNSKVELDDNVLAANAFLFFIAGFETTASTLSYTLFELAKNQNLQQKLYEEITLAMEKYGGQPAYDAIKQMPLLDMVISETLRKYPPAPMLFRECNQDYKVPDSDLILPKGTRVEIPVYALQHDPDIFPEPESYKPERFSEENKNNIPKGAYLPFGDGPRICIGARFAQMEIKVALCKILKHFKVFKNEAMGDKIEFDARSIFILIPKGEILLDIEAR